jgi:ATP-dependent phosphoenolpyruvate carboxykinase
MELRVERNHLPSDFSTIIPEHAVVAAMMCVSICTFLLNTLTKKMYKIYNCIYEYASGDYTKSFFSGNNYQLPYEGILRMISLVNRSLPHKSQWE